MPKQLPAEATGSGEIRLAGGRLAGEGSLDIVYERLGSGRLAFRFTEAGRVSGEVAVHLTPPLVDEVTAEGTIDEDGNLSASATVAVGVMTPSVPGLSLVGGTVSVGYENGRPTGGLAGFTASYAGLGTVTITEATVDRQARLDGRGEFSFEIPGLETASGQISVVQGRLSGSLTLAADKFPEGLPVRQPRITARYTDGVLGVAGSARVDLGPAGRGDFRADWSEDGVFSFGADVTLTIPALSETQVHVDLVGGQLTAEADIPVNTALLPGLEGAVRVRYAQDRWSGETTLSYSADDGKLSGTITVTVAQTEPGGLEVGGSGSVTAQLAPRLQGTLTATILPEGAVDVSGTIEVTEPLQLFDEKRMDKELFRHSQNIPLWAILVAVIRIRAGVRAGVGPGVFRNIVVEGSYTIGANEADPSFTISGELYIPAFVEGYVAFGAGLGLDVVLGSLTGGIEAVGTAGLYGAISVVPELSYADGDWGIEGTATLAAGARLKLGLNAWAEIEALWVTVWDREWELAQHVMPIGPDLALRAKLNYKFGSPQPPEIEFDSSDIDADSLIQAAMPKDGPAASGAREALENKAEWQGALREQRSAPVPPEVAQEAEATEQPPNPPPRRPPEQQGRGPAAGGPAGGGPAGSGPAGGGPGPSAAPPSQPTRSDAADAAATPDGSLPDTVPADQLPNADAPRYPGPITLATLDEPPAPLPRTAQQEQADLDAAAAAVEVASQSSSDSDRLDDYFAVIKQRFRLARLGYEGDFARGFRVVGKINPEFTIPVKEPLTGTGLPSDLESGHITKIAFRSESLHGAGEVGVEMEAWPLGPDHPQGSGPGGQDALMGLLPVNPSQFRPADQRYVRGHLLNDNLGGPGEARNLFPITAQANARHHSAVEGDVKKWVNDKRYWVDYSVRIRNIGPFRPLGSGKKAVDAEIRAKASVLDTQLQTVSGLTREVTIASTYEVGDAETIAVVQTEDEALLEQQRAREADQDVEVQLSSRHRDASTKIDPALFRDLDAAVGAMTMDGVIARLTTFKGFGDVSGTVLRKVYGQVKQRGVETELVLDSSEKGVLTRITNLWEEGLHGLL